VTDSSRALFLSYASQDAEAAGRICEALRAAGIEVWFDQSELRGGDTWDALIRRQIKGCYLFVPIISGNTQSREEGYFRREWKLAVDRTNDMAGDRTFLLPIVIDDTPDWDARVPEKFREVQWTRVPAGANTDSFVDHVRHLLSPDAATPSGTNVGSSSLPKSSTGVAFTRPVPRVSRSFALWIMGAAVIPAIGYLMADRFWTSRPGAVERPANAAAPTETAFNPPAHSIAVLPFVNMSGDPKQDYFSDGISEELLDSLSRLNDMKVAARTSSFSFKGQSTDVSSIAHKLNVGSILEGSVRRSADTIRINVQLINAVTGFQIWSRSYDRKLSDILRVQTEVATAVAQGLKIELSGGDSAHIGLGSTTNAEANDAYLRGVELFSKANIEQSEADARAALAEFDTAVSLDPGFALAHAKRADSLLQVSFWEHDPVSRRARRMEAVKAAEQAVSIAPELSDAHLALAQARLKAFLDIAGASTEYYRALALAPGSELVQGRFASFADTLGHFDVAVNAARKSASLDPQNISALIRLAEVLSDARRFDEAAIALRDASVLDPGSQWIAGAKANLLLASGHSDDAVKFCESRDTPLKQWQRSDCLALAYHASGRQSEAKRELEKFRLIDRESSTMFYAAIHAFWGDKAAALYWLRRAEQQREPDLFDIKTDWEFDPIRKEPEFMEFEGKLKIPE
jgi:TolB-like protein/Flp pilus assembly protein TadD